VFVELSQRLLSFLWARLLLWNLSLAFLGCPLSLLCCTLGLSYLPQWYLVLGCCPMCAWLPPWVHGCPIGGMMIPRPYNILLLPSYWKRIWIQFLVNPASHELQYHLSFLHNLIHKNHLMWVPNNRTCGLIMDTMIWQFKKIWVWYAELRHYAPLFYIIIYLADVCQYWQGFWTLILSYAWTGSCVLLQTTIHFTTIRLIALKYTKCIISYRYPHMFYGVVWIEMNGAIHRGGLPCSLVGNNQLYICS